MSRATFLARTNVSRETIERLDAYAALLLRWSERINLVSPKSLEALWERHFLDSAQLLAHAGDARVWADLGSGGGFPGLVVAILAQETHPDLKFHLIEADQRKAVFLRTVAREVGIGVDVIAERIENVPALGADIVSARALAALSQLLSYSAIHLAPGGRALFLKGKDAQNELSIARKHWRFDCKTITSKTHPDSVILSIGDIERV